eukprot:scaffold7033_cov257-Pinguiococcus_pyrenoidosus.AAC.5
MEEGVLLPRDRFVPGGRHLSLGQHAEVGVLQGERKVALGDATRRGSAVDGQRLSDSSVLAILSRLLSAESQRSLQVGKLLVIRRALALLLLLREALADRKCHLELFLLSLPLLRLHLSLSLCFRLRSLSRLGLGAGIELLQARTGRKSDSESDSDSDSDSDSLALAAAAPETASPGLWRARKGRKTPCQPPPLDPDSCCALWGPPPPHRSPSRCARRPRGPRMAGEARPVVGQQRPTRSQAAQLPTAPAPAGCLHFAALLRRSWAHRRPLKP